MIGDSVYRFEDVDSNLDDGEQVLVKITYVDINTVTIAQDEDGIVTITEKATEVEETDDDDEPLAHPELAPEPAQQLGPKYRLEPEGNLFRLYALRTLPGIPPGTRGGLVASLSTLSHQGNCWVTSGSKVTSRDMYIGGNARISSNSEIHGDGSISGDAQVQAVRAEGSLSMSGGAQLHDVDIKAHDGVVNIEGNSYIINSVIEPTDNIRISGCNVENGHIHNNFEVVSFFSSEWGWLSAYRHSSGTVTYAIGCKRRHDLDELLSLAADHDVDPVQRDMLRAFVALAEAARRGWHGYVAPPVVPEQKLVSFADLAQKARAVEF